LTKNHNNLKFGQKKFWPKEILAKIIILQEKEENFLKNRKKIVFWKIPKLILYSCTYRLVQKLISSILKNMGRIRTKFEKHILEMSVSNMRYYSVPRATKIKTAKYRTTLALFRNEQELINNIRFDGIKYLLSYSYKKIKKCNYKRVFAVSGS